VLDLTHRSRLREQASAGQEEREDRKEFLLTGLTGSKGSFFLSLAKPQRAQRKMGHRSSQNTTDSTARSCRCGYRQTL